ncbi:17321_t:CDS:1, partial [Acaulospora colombiana]
SNSGSSDTSGSELDDDIQSENTPPRIPDPLRVSRSIIFTGGPNRMVSTNTFNLTDLNKVSSEFTNSERINLLNSLTRAMSVTCPYRPDQELHHSWQ